MNEEFERVKVTVERSRWLRGEGSTASALLREKDGKMCCLGFVCLALGRTEDQIRDKSSPTCGEWTGDGSAMAGSGTRLIVRTDSGGWVKPSPIERAMVVNDNKDMSDSAREIALQKLLEEIGIDLEFVP